MSSSQTDLLMKLAAQPMRHPPGLVEVLHYGYDLRYGQFRENVILYQEWFDLNSIAVNLDKNQFDFSLQLLTDRAWEAGSHSTLHLAHILWDQLPVTSKGEFLGGLACQLCEVLRPPNWVFSTSEKEAASFILNHVEGAKLTGQVAAEIACNAIRSDLPGILEQILLHSQFAPDAVVNRQHPLFCKDFSRHIATLSTRVLDVLLECAVRCLRPYAVDRLLKLGACPNIPCWNLERSFNEWFNLLSYAVDAAARDGESKMAASQIVDLLHLHGVDPMAFASPPDSL